jgi:hypothetical protein
MDRQIDMTNQLVLSEFLLKFYFKERSSVFVNGCAVKPYFLRVRMFNISGIKLCSIIGR